MSSLTPWKSLSVVAGLALLSAGCGGPPSTGTTGSSGSTATAPAKAAPVFSLAWSEYPSWSVFGVAQTSGLIDGKAGSLGPIEKKWNVDIELKEADYDSCLVMYGSGNVDAVCITNMDVLNPALSRPSTVILPTSTSDGADALLVNPAIKTIQDLKGKKVYGLAKSVSEYTFVRNLEIAGEKEKDYKFTNMDPAAAATAMQQSQAGYDAIVVWNPFVMETLNKRKDSRVLFDSTKIPGEIIDNVSMATASLAKPGGKAFAHAVIDVYYQVNQRLADPKTGDDTLIALGEKFSHLKLDAMKTVVKQTKFYSTPDQGIAVLTGPKLPGIMAKVVKFCVDHEIVPKAPKIGYGKGVKSDVVFDPSYIQEVKGK
jgi:NitT/TauT family transport system substrate-binding protein